jgi:hypothetical protein
MIATRNTMTQYIFLACAFLCFSTAFSCKSAQQERVEMKLYESTEDFLFSYVLENGTINFDSLQKNKVQLHVFSDTAAAVYERHPGDTAKQAAAAVLFYHLSVLQKVCAHYPITSVTEVKDFYTKRDLEFSGNLYSLKSFKETFIRVYGPEMQFVLYNGTRNCPGKLVPVLRPKGFQTQVEEAVKAAVQDSVFIRVKPRSEYVLLPESFSWHLGWFDVQSKEELVVWLNRYRPTENQIPIDYFIDYYPYRWKLNAADSGRLMTNHSLGN